MGGGGQTTSSSSENRPLTGAERADIYKNSVGEILNTYTQSGLPEGGQGSMTTPAQIVMNSPWSGGVQSVGVNGAPSTTTPNRTLYNSSGNADIGSNQQGGLSGMAQLNPFGMAATPDIKMPTSAANPGGINFPMYQSPDYQNPGVYKTFDPDSAAYANILKGYTAPLDAAKETDTTNYNNSAAKRGIWSSGLALQGERDVNKTYAPQYTAAGGAATSAQIGQLQGENAFNQSSANSANAFNQTNAQNKFSAGWAPLNYLSSLWNGTAGNVGGTNTFGAGMNFSV